MHIPAGCFCDCKKAKIFSPSVLVIIRNFYLKASNIFFHVIIRSVLNTLAIKSIRNTCVPYKLHV